MNGKKNNSEGQKMSYFLRASAHGAERVNGLYRQYQRDEGGGWVTNFLETFVNTSFLVGFLSQVS